MSKSYEPEAMAEEQFYTFRQVCERHFLEKEFVVHCVNYGITEVSGGRRKQDWRFPLASIPRLEKAFRLQRDFELEFSALAMILDLLDEVEDLRLLNTALNKRLQYWERDQE